MPWRSTSTRISIEQDEQERLRFSPDDILRIPVHRAINLWIASGTPQPGFVAHTLPIEPLHDAGVADHHRQAQHERGAHHPDKLPDLLAYDDKPRPPNRAKPASGRRHPEIEAAAGNPPENEHGQTRLENLGA